MAGTIKPRKLTPKQRRFKNALPTAKSNTEAAIKAGYSKKTARFIASENLTKPNLKKAIDEEQAKISEKVGIGQQWVVDQFKTNVELGRELGQVSASNNAAENIGKIIGVYEKDNRQRAEILSPVVRRKNV